MLEWVGECAMRLCVELASLSTNNLIKLNPVQALQFGGNE
jgi:hypothetical protein